MAKSDTPSVPQAVHRLRLSEIAFRTLVSAICHQSLRDLALCSPRRLLTTVLKDLQKRISRLDDRVLTQLCRSGAVVGKLEVNIRIDSSTNDRLRAMRIDLEHRLGRPVSVAEAVQVCCYLASLEQID